jgi:hypothetical protein
MAQGDGAAVDVDPRRIEAQLAHAGDRLAGEGLVELDEVDLLDGQPGPLERLARGRHRAHAHDRWMHPGHGRADHAGQRSEAQGTCPLRGHQHQRSRAIVDARGVAGRDRALFAEDAGQGRQRGTHGTGPGVLITLHERFPAVLATYLHGHDLGLEAAGFHGRGRPGLALLGEGILLRARDAPLVGHDLGRLAQRDHRIGRLHARVDEAPAEP